MPYSSVLPLHRSAAVLSFALLIALVAGPARADGSLAGRWDSDSLRDNRVGYYLEITPVPNSDATYVGTLKFSYQDGRQGLRTPVRVVTRGDRVRITARKGSFDKSPGVLRGVFDADESTITLTNCQARLTLVMDNDLESDCVLRPAVPE